MNEVVVTGWMMSNYDSFPIVRSDPRLPKVLK